MPRSRLVDVGPSPSKMLGAIRDELDRGNYSEADRRLTALSPKKLKDRSSRRYIAALLNNLGVQQEKFGGTALSVKAFKKSVAWDPKNSVAHLNLTQAYWELRDPAMTPEFLEVVIRLAPEDPFPHLALADLLVSKGKPAFAAAHLAQARLRAERDPNHRVYLHKLAAKVEAMGPVALAKSEPVLPPRSLLPDVPKASTPQPVRSSAPLPEPAKRSGVAAVAPSKPLPPPDPKQQDNTVVAAVSKGTTPAESSQPMAQHFVVRFEGPADESALTRTRAILNYAFEELTQKYGYVPKKPLPLVLPTNEKFIGGGGSPAWADSLFDGPSGTMHLAMQGAFEDLGLFSRVVRHQFVHALLFEQMKGQGEAIPHWLAEGLAIHLAEDPWADLEEHQLSAVASLKLSALQNGWARLPAASLPNAYAAASSATQLLIDSYSVSNVRRVVGLIHNGQSIDQAMRKTFSVSYDDFQRQWEHNQQRPVGLRAS